MKVFRTIQFVAHENWSLVCGLLLEELALSVIVGNLLRSKEGHIFPQDT